MEPTTLSMRDFTKLLLARDLSLPGHHDFERLAGEVTEIKRMLTSFVENLRAFANQT